MATVYLHFLFLMSLCPARVYAASTIVLNTNASCYQEL